jgi:hypothetical protein
MKKIIALTVMISICTFFAYGQDTRFGVTAGAAIASMKAKSGGVSLTTDGKIGPTVGVLASIPVTEMFRFLPILSFLQKGGKLKYSGSGYTSEEKQTLSYLELLLNMVYYAPAGNGSFFAGLGPAISFGMSGKYKYKETGQPDEEGDIEFGSNENTDHYKPLEVGGNLIAGYEFANGFFAALNYNLGLSNIDVEGNSDNSSKTRYFGIRVGYFFARKK